MNPATDHELLERTHRGEATGAREFWSRFAPGMLAYARVILRRYGGEPAASDAVQTVLCRVLELDRRAVARVTDVRAFLISSVRHVSLNVVRSAERARARESAHGVGGGGREGGDALERALAALDPLDDDERELLVLKHAAGLTFDQIALSLDLNRSTVAARYRRAVGSLRSAGAGGADGADAPGAARRDTVHPEANHV